MYWLMCPPWVSLSSCPTSMISLGSVYAKSFLMNWSMVLRSSLILPRLYSASFYSSRFSMPLNCLLRNLFMPGTLLKTSLLCYVSCGIVISGVSARTCAAFKCSLTISASQTICFISGLNVSFEFSSAALMYCSFFIRSCRRSFHFWLRI